MRMRFLVDECTGPSIAKHLESMGHDVFSVYDSARGISDEEVLRRAVENDYVLITDDKDFGDLVFKDRKPHKGVILLRISDGSIKDKINILDRFLDQYSERIENNFCVVSEKTVRIVTP